MDIYLSFCLLVCGGLVLIFFTQAACEIFKNVFLSIKKHLDEPKLLYCYLSYVRVEKSQLFLYHWFCPNLL